MPRIDKESKKDDVKDKVKKVTASKSKTSKTPVKKVSKQSKSTSKSDKAVLKDTKESSIKKSKSASSKKSTSIKSKTRKTKIVKVPSLATTRKKSVPKKTKKEEKKDFASVLEYYDLPYRYNETTVKVLAQTPNTLFVYWDISDDDKKSYIEKYGEYFFNNTKPVLVVHNKTNNSTFEVDINDFANSWYLHILDSDCDYQIDLGRRPINNYVSIENDYLYVTSSNEMETPNDHILFDHLNNNIYFKNVKTNTTSKKNIANLSLLKKISKISDIKNFYQALYPEEMINFERLDLSNPSSSNPTSSFK